MPRQDYTALNEAHEANAAKPREGKPLRLCDLMVTHTPEEYEEIAKLGLHDGLALHRKILAERGVPKSG